MWDWSSLADYVLVGWLAYGSSFGRRSLEVGVEGILHCLEARR